MMVEQQAPLKNRSGDAVGDVAKRWWSPCPGELWEMVEVFKPRPRGCSCSALVQSPDCVVHGVS